MRLQIGGITHPSNHSPETRRRNRLRRGKNKVHGVHGIWSSWPEEIERINVLKVSNHLKRRMILLRVKRRLMDGTGPNLDVCPPPPAGRTNQCQTYGVTIVIRGSAVNHACLRLKVPFHRLDHERIIRSPTLFRKNASSVIADIFGKNTFSRQTTI